MKFELIITNDPNNINGQSPNVYLDTYDSEPISFNFNITDISDLSAKKSSYSKTIKLPDTDNNRIVFTDIFNIDSSLNGTIPSSFNVSKKVRCYATGDNILLFKGNLQLTNIVYDYNTNEHFYEVVIFADNDTLFKTIGEKYLSDLDLSSYDHTFNRNNIISSWGLNGGDSTFTNGYFYPLIDYGYGFYLWRQFSIIKNPIRYDFLKPAVYAKVVFDKIFSEAGYSYTSDFLNSERFTDLILPFSNGNLKPSLTTVLGNNNILFDANRTGTFSLVESLLSFTGPLYGRRYFSSLECNNDVFDPNNLYDTTNHNFTNPESSKIKFGVKFIFIVENVAPITNLPGVFWWDFTDDIKIWCKRSYKSDGTINPSWSDTPTYEELTDINNPNYFEDITFGGNRGISIRNNVQANDNLTIENIIQFQKWRISGIVETDFLDSNPLRAGEEVRFFVTRLQPNAIQPPNIVYDNKLYIDINTEIYAVVDTNTLVINSPISLKDIVPTKVKQKDFLTSIFKMFNLFIEPSSEIDRHFIIEPRDEYYRKYIIAKDWSNKLDLNTQISSQVISNVQKRTNKFTYKEDKDFYNEKYKTITDETFGQFLYEIDNDFLSDENVIEPLFSPTPIDRLPSAQILPIAADIYLPIIANFNNGNFVNIDGMNPRILYRKLLSTQTQYSIYDVVNDSNDLYSFYPYAGPFDDPKSPNISLNFGRINPFHSNFIETNRNLFNLYYRNQTFELNDINNRLITCNLYLDYNDINTFKFSDLIFLTIDNMSGWYRVNKIIDYDPLADVPTKVELMKAYNYSLPDIWSTGTFSVVPQQFCQLKLTYPFALGFYTDLFLAAIKNYIGTPYQYLIFFIKEVAFEAGNIPTQFAAYPTPITMDLQMEDLQTWFNTSPLGTNVGFSLANDEWLFDWKIEVPCGLTKYGISVAVSSATNSLNDIVQILKYREAECPCDDTFLERPQQSNGTLNELPLDNVYLGVLNTNVTNRTTAPNVLMVGSNNYITNTNNVSVGNFNASDGNNNFVIGESNQISNNQSLTIGQQNITNSKNSLSIGESNQISTSQTFVLGYGNISNTIERDLIQSQILGTTSFFATASIAGTQSLVVLGNENISRSNSGFILGSNNLIGPSVSNTKIFGDNNNVGYTSSGPSSSSINDLFIFGNNNNINLTGTESSSSLYIFGNDITLTQSNTASLFYIGTDTIEINTQNFIIDIFGTASINELTIGELYLEKIDDNPIFQYTFGLTTNGYNNQTLEIYGPGSGVATLEYSNPYNDNGLEIKSIFGDPNLVSSLIQNKDQLLLSNSNFGSTGYISHLMMGPGYNENYAVVDFVGQIKHTISTYTGSLPSPPYPITFGEITKFFNSQISNVSSNLTEFFWAGISTTSSNVLNLNVTQLSTGAPTTLEVEIQGIENPIENNKCYFGRKIASFYGAGVTASQVGTTTTIYENTDFATYSFDINMDGPYLNISFSGGATQTVDWKIFAKMYQ